MQVHLYTARDEGHQELQLSLCTPKDDQEQCPITQDVITAHDEANEELPHALMQTHPELTCFEIVQCKHRFNARALLLHFMYNKLNCPLCRHGTNAPVDLSSGTLAEESWVPHAMQMAIRSVLQERERQSRQDWFIAHGRYADITMRVSLGTGQGGGEWMQSRMACVDTARGIYRMPSSALRVLRRLHGRLCAGSMRFEVLGRVQEEDPPMRLMSTEPIRTFALLGEGMRVARHDSVWEHHSTVVDENGASITFQLFAPAEAPWDFREIIFQLPFSPRF